MNGKRHWQFDEVNLSVEKNHLLWRQVNGILWSEVILSLWSNSSWLSIAEALSPSDEENLCYGGEESHYSYSLVIQMTC